MEVLEIRAFDGPSIYSHKPVMRIRIDLGVYRDRSTETLAGFTEQLLAMLPGLLEHHCSKKRRGGFAERLIEGTYLGHVLEHIALEVQIMLGYNVNYGKARWTGRGGIYDVIYAYGTRECGIEAGSVAVRLIKSLLENEVFNLAGEIESVKRVIATSGLGPSTEAIYTAAKQRGIPVRRVGEASILILGYGRKQRTIQATTTQRTGSIAADIACDKALTKELLAEAGIPVPFGGVVNTVEAAVKMAGQLGVPVVVKPSDGSKGQGVSIGVADVGAIEAAFHIAREFSEKVIVEEVVKGRQYRVLVVGDKVIAVAERIPTHVVGDGMHNIAELIDIVNTDPNRGEDHEKPLTKIKVDIAVLKRLERSCYTLQSIPAHGEIVYLRENANLSTGGTAIDTTDQIHPDNCALAIRAAQRIGLDVAGIDIVTEDIGKSIRKNTGAIIEVNAAPGIRMHHYPSKGKPRKAAEAIVETLFPPGERGRIPVIAVTGTNGKTTSTRMIGHILATAGLRVGMTTTDGVFIGKDCIINGDTTGPDSARAVLYDPTIEIAVLETARGGMVRAGLAFDECEVAVVTNVSEDHLGQDGIEDLADLAYVKSLVVETVPATGYVVLNADDPYTLEMSKRCKGRVVLFSIENTNRAICRHLGNGGMALFLRDGYIVCAQGKQWEEIIRVQDIPVTFGGIALHNLQNAIVATAVALCKQIPPVVIQQSMRTFSQNPGRLNLIEVGNFRVMVDYGHNPAGYEALIHTLKQLKAKRLVGVIAAPGDRRNDVIQNIGRIAGHGFDRIIVKEDKDLRGRSPGETANLLLRGALEAGRTDHDIEMILSEDEAVLYALENAQENDLIAICYEKYDAVMGVINRFCLKQHHAEAEHTAESICVRVAIGSVGSDRELTAELV